MGAACLPDGTAASMLPADCWQQIFGNDRPVAIEIGPGRGEFLLTSARAAPERNFFAIEHSRSRTREISARLQTRHRFNSVVDAGQPGFDEVPTGS